jgi:hypothetical protein
MWLSGLRKRLRSSGSSESGAFSSTMELNNKVNVSEVAAESAPAAQGVNGASVRVAVDKTGRPHHFNARGRFAQQPGDKAERRRKSQERRREAAQLLPGASQRSYPFTRYRTIVSALIADQSGISRCSIAAEVRPASAKKLRGPTFIGLICDELAHWALEEYLQDPDVAILAAARPGMLTMRAAGWGMVVMTSSPFVRRGELWNMYDQHYGKDETDYLVALGSTRAFNPLVPQSEIDRELAKDYETNKAEYLSLWRDDLEGYVRREAVESCISYGVYERPWSPGNVYFAFMDPATGSGSDSWTLCIGHVKGGTGNVIVIDLLREWRPGFKVHEVVDEICRVCGLYYISKVVSDNTGKWVESHFTHGHGLLIDTDAKPKHDLYLNLLAYVNSARIELLDHPRSILQLLSLQRSKTKIDHPPRGNDDLINAIGGVADIAIGKWGNYLGGVEGYKLWVG